MAGRGNPRPTDDNRRSLSGRIIATASAASQMFAIAENWDLGDRGFQLSDRVPISASRIVCCSAVRGVQRDMATTPFVNRDPAGLDVGQQRIEQPLRNLIVIGTANGVAAPTASRRMARIKLGLAGTAAPPPLRVNLGGGAAEVDVECGRRGRPSHSLRIASPSVSDRCRRSAGCAALVRSECHHSLGLGVAGARPPSPWTISLT